MKQQPLKEFVDVVCLKGNAYVLLSSGQVLTVNRKKELVGVITLDGLERSFTLVKGVGGVAGGGSFLAGSSGGQARLVTFKSSKSPPRKGQKEREDEKQPLEQVFALPRPSMLGFDAPEGMQRSLIMQSRTLPSTPTRWRSPTMRSANAQCACTLTRP